MHKNAAVKSSVHAVWFLWRFELVSNVVFTGLPLFIHCSIWTVQKFWCRQIVSISRSSMWDCIWRLPTIKPTRWRPSWIAESLKWLLCLLVRSFLWLIFLHSRFLCAPHIKSNCLWSAFDARSNVRMFRLCFGLELRNPPIQHILCLHTTLCSPHLDFANNDN